MNKNKTELSFEKLVLELREQILEKLKTVKTVYRPELSTVTKSKKSGAGTDDLYKPKLVWFELQYPPCE
jgi:hypothetical protein